MGLLNRRMVVLAGLVSFAGTQAASAQVAPLRAAARDETADRMAIEQLTIEYAYLLDHGRAGELAALFTPDATLETLEVRAIGREAIAAYYARRAADPRTTRHVSTNLRLVFEGPDRATGTRTILYYRGDGAGPPFPAKPGAVGEYFEVFERGKDGTWRFASRVNKLLFGGSTKPDTNHGAPGTLSRIHLGCLRIGETVGSRLRNRTRIAGIKGRSAFAVGLL